jgi:hypothetical protein
MIKVSVILPVIPNSLQTYQTVFNLLSQNLTDIEVLAAGDTEIGEWAKLLPQETGYDKRLRIIDTKAITEAEIKNEAMQQSKGEYLIFVQAGDRLLPQMLSMLYSLASRYHLDAVGCGYAFLQAQGGIPRPGRQELESYLYEDFIALTKKAFENRFLDLVEKRQMYETYNKIYSAEFLQRHGILFPKFAHLEDRLFNLECARSLKNFAFISRPMYQHVIREEDQVQGPYCLQRFEIVSAYHRQLTEMFQKWGKYTRRAEYRIDYLYVESVVHCFSQLYNANCDMSMRDKLLYIMQIMSQPEVQKAIGSYNPEIPYSKMVNRILRTNNPSIILTMAHGVNLAQVRFNKLFYQLRLQPVDDEIRKTKRE